MMSQPTEDEKRQLMRLIKRIAALYDEHVPGSQEASQGHREGGANPYYNQTENGLFLEFYYGSPQKLWTPWGFWYFAAAITSPSEAQLGAFMSCLTLEESVPLRSDRLGEYGPVYAILAVESEALPEPARQTSETWRDYHAAKEEWSRLFEQA